MFFVPFGKIACEWLRPIYFNSIEGARAGWSPPGAVSLGWFLSDSAYRAVLPGYYKTNTYKFHCILGAVIFENKTLCIINRLSSNNVNIRAICATIGSDKGFSPPGNTPLSKQCRLIVHKHSLYSEWNISDIHNSHRYTCIWVSNMCLPCSPTGSRNWAGAGPLLPASKRFRWDSGVSYWLLVWPPCIKANLFQICCIFLSLYCYHSVKSEWK